MQVLTLSLSVNAFLCLFVFSYNAFEIFVLLLVPLFLSAGLLIRIWVTNMSCEINLSCHKELFINIFMIIIKHSTGAGEDSSIHHLSCVTCAACDYGLLFALRPRNILQYLRDRSAQYALPYWDRSCRQTSYLTGHRIWTLGQLVAVLNPWHPTPVCWLLNVPATCYSVSQGRICSDNFTCCHTETEVAEKVSTSSSHSILTPSDQSQYWPYIARCLAG